MASNDSESRPKLRFMQTADTLYMRYNKNGDMKSHNLVMWASEKCSDMFKAACRIDEVSLDRSPVPCC